MSFRMKPPMKPMTATVVLALAAAMLSAPALASGHRGAGPAAMLEAMNFAQIDANSDGAITLDEWRSFVTAQMDARRTARIDTRVDALMEGDTDGDGALSREELSNRIATLGEERRAGMHEARAERGEGRERGHRSEMRGHGRHGGGYGGHHAQGRMGAADSDTWIVRSFQRVDRDGDGRVTEAEFTQALAQMQERAAHHAERREGRRGGEGRSGN